MDRPTDKNINNYVPRFEPHRHVEHLDLRWYGNRIADDTADVTISTTIAAVVANPGPDAGETERAWYAMLSHDISVPLPHGIGMPENHLPGSKHDPIAFELLQGSWEFKIEAVGPAVVTGTIRSYGPPATSEQTSESHTVSTGVSGNLGFFGETLQGGLSGNFDWSETRGNEVKDMVIQVNQGHSSEVDWSVSFGGMNGAKARSSYQFSVQEIWRFEAANPPLTALDSMHWRVTFVWDPSVIAYNGNSKPCVNADRVQFAYDLEHKLPPETTAKLPAKP